MDGDDITIDDRTEVAQLPQDEGCGNWYVVQTNPQDDKFRVSLQTYPGSRDARNAYQRGEVQWSDWCTDGQIGAPT